MSMVLRVVVISGPRRVGHSTAPALRAMCCSSVRVILLEGRVNNV